MARIPSNVASWWQYAQWVRIIGRTMRITNPTVIEMAAVKVFIKSMYDASNATGSRSWLKQEFDSKSAKPSGYNPGDVDQEPDNIVIKFLGVIARDMELIPITDAEKTQCDTLMTATGDRRYGTSPYFGNASGSLVSIP